MTYKDTMVKQRGSLTIDELRLLPQITERTRLLLARHQNPPPPLRAMFDSELGRIIASVRDAKTRKLLAKQLRA